MRRKTSLAVIALLLSVVPAALRPDACAAGAAGRFSVYNIRVLDRITDIQAADLNGDGLSDLILLHTKGYPPDTQRWVSLFRQKPGGGFPSAADLTWRLPDEVAAIDVGDVLDGPGAELIGLTRSGASVMEYGAAADSTSLHPIVTGVDGVILPSKNEAPLVDFVRDWDGDGRDDVAVPSASGLFLFRSLGDTSFAAPQALEVDTRVSLHVESSEDGSDFDAVSVTRRLPSFTPVDLDGDGDLDIAAHWGDQVRFYLQKDGVFSSRPDSSVWLNLLTDDEKADGNFEVGVAVQDLDGDGLADLFGGKSARRGMADFSSSVVLYYGDGGAAFGPEPDWSASVDGMSRGRWLDVNGDGRKELMLPVVNLGIADIVRILITKKVKIQFWFYFISDDRSIPQKPDFTQQVVLQVGLDAGGGAQIVSFDGDYNGDGRKDMVVATGETELSLFLGKAPSKGQLFERKPAYKIESGTFGVFDPMDLNGDGKDDIIIYNRENPKSSSRARILVNRGSW